MAKTLSAVEVAQAELAALEEQRAKLVQGLAHAEEKRASAGADVDALVESGIRIEAHKTAIAHTDGQISNVRAQLAEAQRAELEAQRAELGEKVDVLRDDVFQVLLDAYEKATDPSLVELAREHESLRGRLAPGPIMGNGKLGELERLQQAIAQALTISGRYEIVQHTDARRELKKVERAA